MSVESLRPADLESFKAIGVSPHTLALMHVRRVTHIEARDLCGIRYKAEHLEGIAFPYLSPEDDSILAWRVRRDHPEVDSHGRPVAKYLSAAGDRKRLYFGPGSFSNVADITVPAIVGESEKSVLAIYDAELRANRRHALLIGLGGCWGWRGVVGKTTDKTGVRVDEKGPLPDFDRVTWTERDAIIVFDANVATNTKVQAARRALATDLRRRGARVRVVTLPIEMGVNGPDDYIGKHGAEAFWALIDSAKPESSATGRTVSLTPASQIHVRPVRWLWEDRVALGTLCLIGGREGIGKSICVYTITADITRGRLRGIHFGSPRAVIVAATEDSWEHTIVPRLMAAGADLDRVYRVDVVTSEGRDMGLSLRGT